MHFKFSNAKITSGSFNSSPTFFSFPSKLAAMSKFFWFMSNVFSCRLHIKSKSKPLPFLEEKAERFNSSKPSSSTFKNEGIKFLAYSSASLAALSSHSLRSRSSFSFCFRFSSSLHFSSSFFYVPFLPLLCVSARLPLPVFFC